MRRLLAPTIAALVGASVIAAAQSQLEVVDPQLWFVEFMSAPTSEGTAIAVLEREEAGFRAQAAGAGIRYTKSRHFRRLWNGVSVRASAQDAARLRSLPGVQAVHPVAILAHTQQVDQPPDIGAELATALRMTGADIAQGELGLTGAGIKVAVIDSGIDYDHPDLGGCFGDGCRVEKGFDLVGDDFNPSSASPSFNPVPAPDPLPDDCNGHGTHVAGIVGANGSIVGTAPGVTLHAYRVFGCDGPTSADVLLEAMERAVDGGADIVNMSIGGAFGWPQSPIAQAANRLVRSGVVVVAAMGNDASVGLYGASAPGAGRNVISVASFDNTHTNLPAFTVGPDDQLVGYNAALDGPAAPIMGTAPIRATGTSSTLDDACLPLPGGSLDGHIALIRRGACSFYQKAFNAQAAGAIGVVIYNNAPGRLTPGVAGTPPVTIPVVLITAVDGVTIDSRLPADLTWTDQIVSEPQPTGGLVSSFSSWGLPADLSFKPDLGAPGGSVRSTVPIEQGSFGTISGTSMSSPHVAGAVALLLEARPDARPGEVMARLQNTAQPSPWAGNPALGFLDNVHRQGAGMLAIDAAIGAAAIVKPSNLALGEFESDEPITMPLHITVPDRHDRPREAVTFTLGHEPALATGANSFAPTFWQAPGGVEFNEPTVTLGGRGAFRRDAWVVASITRPAEPSAKLFGGYLTLTPDDGGPVLRVPYVGYNGDYQEITVLTPTSAGFPWLAKIVGSSLFNQPDGAQYTMDGPDIPYFIFHLDHQPREVKAEVFDAATGKSLNFAFDDDFLPRSATPTSAFLFAWDGTTSRRPGGKVKTVPNGTYRVELTVLKALGDRTNPAHVERWTSPEIAIVRP